MAIKIQKNPEEFKRFSFFPAIFLLQNSTIKPIVNFCKAFYSLKMPKKILDL